MHRLLRSFALLAALALPLTAAQAQSSYLDPSFGTGGWATPSFTGVSEARAVALQPDGKLVAVGSSSAGLIIARFMPDGTLDPAFGSGGKVVGQVVPTSLSQCTYLSTNINSATANSVLIQADGKIVVCGSFDGPYTSTIHSKNRHWLVVRYMPDGTLDTGFGVNGYYSRCGDRRGGLATKVIEGPNGSLLVLGMDLDYSALVGSPYDRGRGLLVRLLPNGTEHPDFPPRYYPVVPTPGIPTDNNYFLVDMYLDDNGRLITAGRNGTSHYVVTRHLADGRIDTSFGNGGVVWTSAGSRTYTYTYSVVKQPAGKSLLYYYVDTGMRVRRLNDNGSVDATFGTNGQVDLPLTWGARLLAQPDGKLLAAGSVGSPNQDFRLVRLTSNGQLDATYGTNGVITAPASTAYDLSNDMVLQPDGKVVLAGLWATSGNRSDAQLAVTRILAPAPGVTWTGAASTAWTDPGNWSTGAVPTATDDVTIPGGLSQYPVLSSSQSVRGLTLASGATLTQTGGTLTLSGAWNNAGTLSQTGGGLALAGTAAQQLGGSTPTRFRELSVGPAGATLAGPVQVQRLLTLQGNLATNNQPLTLLSDASGTAMVVNSGGAVTGAATVQRFIDPATNAGPGYRHLAAPLSGSTVADLGTSTGFTPVVNPNYNTAANPGAVSPFPSVFGYDPTRVTSGFDQGWVSPGALTEALTPGRGYTVNLAPQTPDFVGTLTTGNVDVTLSGASLNGPGGWQLLGNPYPAPINWDLLSKPTGLDNAVYVYRSSGPYVGSYQSYVNGVGPAEANLIGTGQSFFVHLSSGTPTFRFTDAARLTSYAAPSVFRTQETRPLLELAVRVPNQPNDVLYVYQQAGATAGFDPRFDALKVTNNGGLQPTLTQTTPTNQSVSIQAVGEGNQPLSLPLSLYAPAAGTYTFSPQRLVNFAHAAPLYLEDRLSGTWHDLRQGDYAATVPAGLLASRFVLHLYQQRPLKTTPGVLAAAALQVYPNPAGANAALTVRAAGLPGTDAQLSLVNALGQVVRRQPVRLAAGALDYSCPTGGLTAGFYTLRLHTDTGTITRKIVLQ